MKYCIMFSIIMLSCTTKIVSSLDDELVVCSVFRSKNELDIKPPPQIDYETLNLMEEALSTNHKLFIAFGDLIKWYAVNQMTCEHEYDMMVKYAECLESGGKNGEEDGTR